MKPVWYFIDWKSKEYYTRVRILEIQDLGYPSYITVPPEYAVYLSALFANKLTYECFKDFQGFVWYSDGGQV